MSSGSCFFDTNALIAWQSGDADLRRVAAAYGSLVVSTVVVGEMVYGAMNSGRSAANMLRLDQALSDFEIVPIDEAAARVYGQLRVALQKKGRPIPVNDLWIAAAAIERGLPLLSDDAHFRAVDGLDLRGW